MDAPVASSQVDLLPAKRVRKQTDKDFKQTGPQWAPKQYKTNHNKNKAVAPPAPAPVPLSNMFIAPSVALSTYDKASQLTLSKDQLICYGCEVKVPSDWLRFLFVSNSLCIIIIVGRISHG